MTTQIQRSKPHWKTAALGTALGIAIAGSVVFSAALAVHSSAGIFELDGDATDPAGGKDDWQGVFDLGGVVPPATGGAVAGPQEIFIDDLPPTAEFGNKEMQYDAGKDTLDVSAWTRKLVANVTPDKNNITNAYAKNYHVDHDGDPATPDHSIIHFGADRYANNGDAALGFWFFQKKVDYSGSNGFGPAHTARNLVTGQRGDILVQVDFVSGGSSSEIQIFEWVGSGGSHGPLDELGFATANGSTVCADLPNQADAACATTNNAATPSYWNYTPKFGSSGTFPAESFFEGGIDLTAFAGNICLNSFLANTRTSHSETADLKDLALGDFNTCGSIDLVGKTCDKVANVSPTYDAVNEVYQTQHTLTIRNDGGGSDVFDVMVRDNAVNDVTECKITAITGGSGHSLSLPLQIASNAAFYKVANSLAPGVANQMMVTLLCTSPVPQFHNSATVQAGQSPGGSSLVDTYTESDGDVAACELKLDPSLTISKACNKDVVLDPVTFAPKVCVDLSIQNTSSPAQKIDLTSFTDVRMDGTQSNLLANLKTAGGQATDATLDPGETVYAEDCYTPAKPDGSQTDPDLVQYSDFAKVSGRGRALPNTVVNADSNEAVCKLCPIGANN